MMRLALFLQLELRIANN